jgi:hypothetical protein
VVVIVQHLLTVGIQVKVIADWCKGVFSEQTLWREIRRRPELKAAHEAGRLGGKALALMALWRNVEAGQQRAIEYWLERIARIVEPVGPPGVQVTTLVRGEASVRVSPDEERQRRQRQIEEWVDAVLANRRRAAAGGGPDTEGDAEPLHPAGADAASEALPGAD